MGGKDDTDNIIALTTAQHYKAHYLLWRAYRNQQMTCAFHLMTTNKSGREPLSEDEFTLMREDYRKSKRAYWANLSDVELNMHREKCNPWKNKTIAEIDIYKKKCNSWANKTELEKNAIVSKKRGTWDEKMAAGNLPKRELLSDERLASRNKLYIASMAKRTVEQKAARLLKIGEAQAGTIWVNDGARNKRISPLDISDGWGRGRI